MKRWPIILVCLLVASPAWADEPQPDNQPQWTDPDALQRDPKQELLKEHGVDDPDQLEKDLEPKQSELQKPEDRFPKLDKPRDLKNAGQAPNGLNGLPKSPLVQVNKSGVRPQVLKKPAGGGSIKGMGLTFRTNLQTGSASVSLPIALPPARRGLAPSLALGYSSGGSQGVAGLGWDFGIGFIARQTDQGLPRYDDDIDRFVYNGGRELVRVDPGGEQLPSWANANYYYRAKIEGIFMRFFLVGANTSGAYWVAQDKDGTLYFFGALPGQTLPQATIQEGSLICDSTCQRVFRWNLVLVRDVHGNEVRYVCERDLNQSYVTDVLYNNHPTIADRYQHRVSVTYEGRDDALTTYVPGFPVTTGRRIQHITVYSDYGFVDPISINDNDGRKLVRSYELRYVPNQLHSLLEEVQLFGNDAMTSLPPVRFEYTEVDGTHSVPGLGELDGTVRHFDSSPVDSIGDGRRDLLDIDADGLPDIYETDPANPGLLGQYILNTGSALPEGNKQVMSGADQLLLYNTNVRLADFDGNGISEMIHMPLFGQYSQYPSECDPLAANQSGVNRTCRWGTPASNFVNPTIDFTTDAAEIKLLDINGDHLTDVVRTTGTRMEHYLNLGRYEGGTGRFGSVSSNGLLSDAPITSCVLHKGLPVMFSDPRVKLEDMNGDGLQDIVLIDFGVLVYWPNKGYGNWGEGSACPVGAYGGNRYVTMDNAPFIVGFDPSRIHLRDVNSDGLADIVQVRATNVDVWLNAVTEFRDRAIIDKSPFAPNFTDRVRLADMNGSGSRDLLWGDGGNYRFIDLTGGEKPRLLTKIFNGLGGVTEIDYDSSTTHYLNSRQNPDELEWKTHCPFPNWVVGEVKVRDQFDQVTTFTEGVYVTRYKYRDCIYDGVEHEWRGFGEVIEEKVGDQNSPTNYVRHRYYQGDRFDEALVGMEFRTDAWSGDINPDAPGNIFLNTTWNSCAIRKVFPQASQNDAEPGLHQRHHRHVRYPYVFEAHTFGYNTEPGLFQAGTPTDTADVLEVRRELPLGVDESETRQTIQLTGALSITTHLQTDTRIDDVGQVIATIRRGRPGQERDGAITNFTSYNRHEQKWIHRPCESWVQQGSSVFNRKLEFYDGGQSNWSGTDCAPTPPTPANPTGNCDIPPMGVGLSTKGLFEECYLEPGQTQPTLVRYSTQHETDYTDFGLPRHTKEFKKLENWLYYEQQAGYQSLVTREVIRVGVDGVTPDYPDTPIKTLTVRVDYDVGFGVITEYRDENDQKTQAVYDPLARPIELWGTREPYQACGDGTSPTFMRLAEISYHLPDTTLKPYSYVHAKTDEDLCNPDLIDESFVYVDGLGRTRMTVVEGEETTVFPKTPWIATGFVTYDDKGAVKEAFEAAYTQWVPGSSAHPQPVLRNCPNLDDFRSTPTQGDDIVCTTQTRYDAFGRSVLVTLKDGATTRTEYHSPLVTKAFDANDTDPTSPFKDTPTTTTQDGFGRTIETEVVNVIDPETNQTRESYFTTYLYDAVNNLTHLRTCLTGQKWPTPGGCDLDKQIQKRQAFDSLSQRRRIDDPDAGIWTFDFDEAGNLVESCDGRCNAQQGGDVGNRIEYQYDQANRPIVEKCLTCDGKGAGVVLVRYFYDSAPRMSGGQGFTPVGVADEPMDFLLGRISYIEDESGQLYFSYDRRGRVKTEIRRIEAPILPGEVIGGQPVDPTGDLVGGGAVYVSRTEYDDDDRVTRQVYPEVVGEPSLVVQREYNRRGLLKRIFGDDPLDPGNC